MKLNHLALTACTVALEEVTQIGFVFPDAQGDIGKEKPGRGNVQALF